MERGKPWGNRERQQPNAPTGSSTAQPDPVPRPPLHRGSVSAAKAFIALANVQGKSGAPHGPAQGGVPPTAPRRCPPPRCLQLAGHLEGGEQGHQAGLLHRPSWPPTLAGDQMCIDALPYTHH